MELLLPPEIENDFPRWGTLEPIPVAVAVALTLLTAVAFLFPVELFNDDDDDDDVRLLTFVWRNTFISKSLLWVTVDSYRCTASVCSACTRCTYWAENNYHNYKRKKEQQ